MGAQTARALEPQQHSQQQASDCAVCAAQQMLGLRHFATTPVAGLSGGRDQHLFAVCKPGL